MNQNYRSISKDKIPKPPFDYDKFSGWLNPKKKFIIEIGCGVGYHPIRKAQYEPNSQILAIERTREKFDKFISRLKHHTHLKNIFSAHADATVLLPHLLEADQPSVDEYYILYPNPYPKNKHKNIRFAYSPILKFIADTLKPQTGRLILATNIEAYAKEMLEQMHATQLLKIESYQILRPIQADINSNIDLTSLISERDNLQLKEFGQNFFPRSHFEKKYLLQGQTCYNLVFSKSPPT